MIVVPDYYWHVGYCKLLYSSTVPKPIKVWPMPRHRYRHSEQLRYNPLCVVHDNSWSVCHLWLLPLLLFLLLWKEPLPRLSMYPNFVQHYFLNHKLIAFRSRSKRSMKCKACRRVKPMIDVVLNHFFALKYSSHVVSHTRYLTRFIFFLCLQRQHSPNIQIPAWVFQVPEATTRWGLGCVFQWPRSRSSVEFI